MRLSEAGTMAGGPDCIGNELAPLAARGQKMQGWWKFFEAVRNRRWLKGKGFSYKVSREKIDQKEKRERIV